MLITIDISFIRVQIFVAMLQVLLFTMITNLSNKKSNRMVQSKQVQRQNEQLELNTSRNNWLERRNLCLINLMRHMINLEYRHQIMAWQQQRPKGKRIRTKNQ